ncbi:fructosamine kinase family protein [Rhodocytophaga rosea]|uniref:Fructosamine kinase family protein n=2 Tax=Rhodocytophaga rosea TaxID=2704465 RepID=A0A6C0GWY1_9BACT|nr:fructosamine kinase family protein [Rhodocytophaga rosea]
MHLEQIQFFETILFESVGQEVHVSGYQFMGGGNINNAVSLDTDQGYFFVKWNESGQTDAFSCEASGLELLRRANEIPIPEVIGFGQNYQKAYLILEYIHSSRPQYNYWERFGHSLARLHTHTNHSFGLSHNNYIGSLQQINTPAEKWVEFFVEKRLKIQAGLALYNGELPKALFNKFEDLYKELPHMLPAAVPSLLHGDLWSGNVMVGPTGEVMLIDPAVYYGNREAELAFTKLFGGFPDNFYGAYNEISPLEPDFDERAAIYNLYPLLVHVNLFGSGYLSGIEKVLKRF